MTKLTMFEATDILRGVGFRPEPAASMLAIGIAESALNTRAVNVTGNHPPSRDRGWLQINDYWHPEVTDDEAFDPLIAAAAGYRISHQGSDFTAWSTWTSGAASRYLVRTRQVVAIVFDPGTGIALRRMLRLQLPPLPLMHGHDVAVVQHLLGVAADGNYGTATAAAVKHFQEAEGITTDGIVGPVTARRLNCVWVAGSA